MDITKDQQDYIHYKLDQAHEALEDAKGLLEDGADLTYVVNSIYYAFYYPVLALLSSEGRPQAMQSVIISLFEQRFKGSDSIDDRYFEAIRTAFELKPKCSAILKPSIDRVTVERLLAEAGMFQESVKRALA